MTSSDEARLAESRRLQAIQMGYYAMPQAERDRGAKFTTLERIEFLRDFVERSLASKSAADEAGKIDP